MAHFVIFSFSLLFPLGLGNPFPQTPNPASTSRPLTWVVIGDSWASGVAYNTSNVYGRFDLESCYRIKEAWGVQMAEDTSWQKEAGSNFNFAACGGTLMSDIQRQFTKRAGLPDIVWGMFGGNDAFFGAIVRACIYQPKLHSDWGPPWDKDPNGVGHCKKNLANAAVYINGDNNNNNGKGLRMELVRTLDELFLAAAEKQIAELDVYISAYVHFFNVDTDDCDTMTFAHDQFSQGFPSVVKGLRKEMNDKVSQFNTVQGEVIKAYQAKLPQPGKRYRLRHVEPSPLFNKHRFCEAGQTIDDQFYSPDVWMWNLQYWDTKSKSDRKWKTTTTKDGIKIMTNPDGAEGAGFPTANDVSIPPILAIQVGPDEDQPANNPLTQQYGFGFTARPFHPKYQGHTALKDFFIKRMREDNIPGVKPAGPLSPNPGPASSSTRAPTPSGTPAPPPPPSPPGSIGGDKNECRGLGKEGNRGKYVERNAMRDAIEGMNKNGRMQIGFCQTADESNAQGGVLEQVYFPNTPNAVKLRVSVGGGGGLSVVSQQDCVNKLLRVVVDGCDGDNKANVENAKGGGKLTTVAGAAKFPVVYEMEPLTTRQPFNMPNKDGSGCEAAAPLVIPIGKVSPTSMYTMWGKGWATSDLGEELKLKLGGCGLNAQAWQFKYELGDKGREVSFSPFNSQAKGSAANNSTSGRQSFQPRPLIGTVLRKRGGRQGLRLGLIVFS